MSPELRAFVAGAPVQRGAIVACVREQAAQVSSGARVLDAGAGDAPYRPFFAHCDYVTQDWPGSVHDGAARADVVADLHDLPPDIGSFDFVLCTEVLEHVADPAVVLAELHRVLAPNGRIFVSTPFVGGLHEEPHDYWRPTSYAMRMLLEQAGFADAHVEPLTGWWSTLAQLLRFQGLATQPLGERAPAGVRTLSAFCLAASLVLTPFARSLDRLDRRKALPLGWWAVARRP